MMRATHPLLSRGERIAERQFGLRHGADCGPLLHVICYFSLLITLRYSGHVVPWPAFVVLWCLLVMLNFSLTIGIHHLHAHHPVFRWTLGNRILEQLLCVPSLLTHTEMLVFHIHNHHRYEDGPQDAATTRGYERGLRALYYWVVYPFRVRVYVVRALFERRYRGSPLRWLHPLNLLCSIAFLAVLFDGAPDLFWSLWAVPMLLTGLNSGYFSWLTHAPARREEVPGHNASLNTTNNWMNLFVFNQGYHAIHHARPGIHWSDIPSHFSMMADVDDELIVSYWVTLTSAWRLLFGLPAFRDAEAGRRWRAKLRSRSDNARLPFLSYFGWV